MRSQQKEIISTLTVRLDIDPGVEFGLGILYSLIDEHLEGKLIPDHVAEVIEDRYYSTEHKRTLPISYQPPLATKMV